MVEDIAVESALAKIHKVQSKCKILILTMESHNLREHAIVYVRVIQR
jgi:archaellum biogenesis ATPase FlaH